MNSKSSIQNAKLLAVWVLLTVLAFSLAACSKEQGGPHRTPSRVSATADYEKYFGPAPTSDKGSCFAFVIYFPSAVERGKLIPFPFFTFDEPSIKKVSVERLLGGMEVPAYRGELRNPFPVGTHLITMSERNGVIGIELSSNSSIPRNRAAAGHALAQTLSQFPGVKGVDLIEDGVRTKLKAVPGAVKDPGPPRLLGVSASKEKGKKGVEDVSALFDRPVEIREIWLADRNGKTFQGDMYHSVFDMAAVLKPRDASAFQPAMPVKVRWKVVDRKGRAGAGEAVLPLEMHEH